MFTTERDGAGGLTLDQCDEHLDVLPFASRRAPIGPVSRSDRRSVAVACLRVLRQRHAGMAEGEVRVVAHGVFERTLREENVVGEEVCNASAVEPGGCRRRRQGEAVAVNRTGDVAK